MCLFMVLTHMRNYQLKSKLFVNQNYCSYMLERQAVLKPKP